MRRKRAQLWVRLAGTVGPLRGRAARSVGCEGRLLLAVAVLHDAAGVRAGWDRSPLLVSVERPVVVHRILTILYRRLFAANLLLRDAGVPRGAHDLDWPVAERRQYGLRVALAERRRRALP